VGIVGGTTKVNPKVKAFREYIQTELSEPLKKDKKYCVTFYAHHSTYSQFTINELGLALSSKRIRERNGERIDFNPQITSGNIEFDTLKWIKICDVYVAQGSEKIITIGNFLSEENTKYTKVNVGAKKSAINLTAYYFIDDVSVVPIEDNDYCDCTEKPEPAAENKIIESGKSRVLENVYFETGKSELKPQSFSELDKIAEIFTANPALKAEISGHTDNTGKPEDNKKLSEERARAVVEYLVTQGVKREQLTYKGYGSEQWQIPRNRCKRRYDIS
jgi:OmpA-OmpF porin, OOP family